MASQTTPICQFGLAAPDFQLPATDGRRYRLDELRGSSGFLLMFICNHCPYVKAIREALVETCRELASYGIGCAAISSNDPSLYPEDDFEHMKAYAKAYRFPFPYLYDEDQRVARAYGAVCTPDFFGYNSELQLQYRGRFRCLGPQRPSAWRQPRPVRGHEADRHDRQAGPQAQIAGHGLLNQVASSLSFFATAQPSLPDLLQYRGKPGHTGAQA